LQKVDAARLPAYIESTEVGKINNKTKILVVDDDPEILLLTATVLRRAGYEVLEASAGEEGLKMSITLT
jgi:response regulator RpfG family c-di-GMP phosphodiesterase